MWACIFLILAVGFCAKLFLAPLTQINETKKLRREMERQRRGY